MTSPTTSTTPPGLDIVWHARGIGAVLGLEPRQVNYLVARGLLPVGRLGAHLFSTRAVLAEYLASAISVAAVADEGEA